MRISRKEHVTNEMVEDWMGCQLKLGTRLRKRKARFAGHFPRGSNGGFASLVIEGTVEGTRDRGRPRRTWRKTSQLEQEQLTLGMPTGWLRTEVSGAVLLSTLGSKKTPDDEMMSVATSRLDSQQ